MRLRPLFPTTPLLSPALLLRGLGRGRTGLDGHRYFALGRHALVAIAQETGVERGVLLVPSYICVEALDPLLANGQAIQYYPVRENLEPDWGWLENRVSPWSRALLLVHYFGFPNDLRRALAFCRERGLLLIEDCAHSLLTSFEGKPTGTFGDFGFYSLRKFLPVLDGGVLLRGPNGATSPSGNDVRPFGPTPYRTLLRQLAKYLLVQVSLPAPSPSRPDPAPGNGLPAKKSSPIGPPQGISRFSYGIMRALEPKFEAIVARRRQNYSYLLDRLSDMAGLRPLFRELPPGVCPMLYPALAEERAALLARLWNLGIPAGTWPQLPDPVARSGQFPVARRYAEQVITLPVHQDLSPNHLRRMAEACLA